MIVTFFNDRPVIGAVQRTLGFAPGIGALSNTTAIGDPCVIAVATGVRGVMSQLNGARKVSVKFKCEVV